MQRIQRARCEFSYYTDNRFPCPSRGILLQGLWLLDVQRGRLKPGLQQFDSRISVPIGCGRCDRSRSDKPLRHRRGRAGGKRYA